MKKKLSKKSKETENAGIEAEKLKSELSKAQNTINHLKTTKIAELELEISNKDSEIELLKQMIRSLKTDVKVKVTDISRLTNKVERLNEQNDMRHEFIQSHFKKNIKQKKEKERINHSMIEESEGLKLPPLAKAESKQNVLTTPSTNKKSRKGS